MESLNLPAILTPDFGLFFWMLVAFLVVFLLLAKFGFPVITGMVEERKNYIDESLRKAHEAQERGAGEILFTSMNHDGTKNGYANEALRELADNLSIPIIASGGAGCKEHFRDTFIEGHSDAALAASVFHFGEIPIPELKQYLKSEGINVRI